MFNDSEWGKRGIDEIFIAKSEIVKLYSLVNEFKMYCALDEFLGIDAEAIKFESNIFPEIHNIANSWGDPERLETPEHWTGTVLWQCHLHVNVQRYCLDSKKHWRNLRFEFRESKNCTQRFPQGHWTLIGPGKEMKWYGTRDFGPDGKWNSIAAKMVKNFRETMHPVFTSVNALNSGILRQMKGKTSMHFNAEATNSELLFLIVFSANQLSVYGAVATCCYQCGSREFEEPGNPSDYHLAENDYSFDALQFDCFRIKIKM